MRNVSSFGGVPATSLLSAAGLCTDGDGLFPYNLESMSIFSSFSSNRSLNSLTSVSSCRTRSSNDSVYPRGKARRLSLSLVLHSKPTLAHWEQHGRMPSQRIFLLRHRSQAWAMRL